MKIRAALLAVLWAVALFFVHQEEYRASLVKAEQGFLDFLVANARDALEKKSLPASPEVVFVEFRAEDKAEYSTWPPAPLDYIMVLKKLAEHEPRVLAFTMPLNWENSTPQFVGEMQKALLPFTSVVLGFDGKSTADATQETKQFFAEELPRFANVESDSSLAPSLIGISALPNSQLRTQMQLGFVSLAAGSEKSAHTPMVARHESQLVPSLAAQSLALYGRIPYANQQLRFGMGAGLYLGSDWFVPLGNDGSASPQLQGEMTRVNALEIMTPDPGDNSGLATSAALGKDKLIILGVAPAEGEAQAKLVTWALSLPRLYRAGVWADQLAAAVMIILAFFQLRRGRFASLVFGGVMLVVSVLSSLLTFQSSLVWWSPLLSLVIIAVSSAFCFLWPNRAQVAPE
jgi:hypothetical protein